jgi:hypothetical protein
MELDSLNKEWLNDAINRLERIVHQSEIENLVYKNTKNDMLVILCFFSVVDYKKPIENYTKTTKKLKEAKIPFKTIGLLLPNRTKNVDADLWLETDSVLFYKENLYNVMYSKNRTFKKICFMDADVIFDLQSWYDEASKLLDHYDLVQPFDTCKWFDENKKTNDTGQIASTVAISQKINFVQAYYHPGFAWCFKSKVFEQMNGFYDWVTMGEGDICLANSFVSDKDATSLSFKDSDLYRAYARKLKELKLKIGFLKSNTAYHLYHGKLLNRRYEERYKFISSAIHENPKKYLAKDPDGLIHWKNPSSFNQKIIDYFRARKEDS